MVWNEAAAGAGHNITFLLATYRPPLLIASLSGLTFHAVDEKCEFQKTMRLVSEYTQEDANSFFMRRRGRMDQHLEAHGRAVKLVYIHPLCRDVQRRLAQGSTPRWISHWRA